MTGDHNDFQVISLVAEDFEDAQAVEAGDAHIQQEHAQRLGSDRAE